MNENHKYITKICCNHQYIIDQFKKKINIKSISILYIYYIYIIKYYFNPIIHMYRKHFTKILLFNFIILQFKIKNRLNV